MSHAKALYDWERRVATHFPDLPRARRRWLALASFGVALAECALLTAVALKLAAALGLTRNALRQRARKLYRSDDFDVTACFGPLLRWATAGFKDRRLALAVDPTNLGDRFTVLTVSVVFRSCAVPVAWQALRADQKGSWNGHWERLLGVLRDALGGGEHGEGGQQHDRGADTQEDRPPLPALHLPPAVVLSLRTRHVPLPSGSKTPVKRGVDTR